MPPHRESGFQHISLLGYIQPIAPSFWYSLPGCLFLNVCSSNFINNLLIDYLNRIALTFSITLQIFDYYIYSSTLRTLSFIFHSLQYTNSYWFKLSMNIQVIPLLIRIPNTEMKKKISFSFGMFWKGYQVIDKLFFFLSFFYSCLQRRNAMLSFFILLS